MRLSEKTWQRTEGIYTAITNHPFINALIDGSLAQEKFLYYIKQDAIYLAEYGRVLAALAAKLPNADHSEAFLSFAKDSIAVERALHASYSQVLNNAEASPACLLYTSYLWKELHTAPVEVALATVLPCFWIYKEVGEYILAHQTMENNPYQAWIDTYGGEEFAQAVKTAIAIYDELADTASAKTQEAMMQTFITCSKMEWLFWDSAYRLEKWAI